MRWHFIWIVLTFHQVNIVEHPTAPNAITAPGGNITLGCSFSAKEPFNLLNLIINWQHGDMVVHSFYHSKDQLEKQGERYRGRTHLFKDQLKEGNASLLLLSVQPDDKGEYICHVTNEQGSSSGKISLVLAAPFDEPLLALQPACESINITVTLSNGFPEPQLRWRGSSGGGDLQQTYSSVLLDTKRYQVSSTINFRPNGAETVTMEMKLEVLNQSINRSLLIHPLPECCLTTTTPEVWKPMAITFLMLFLILLAAVFIWIFLIRKRRRSG